MNLILLTSLLLSLSTAAQAGELTAVAVADDLGESEVQVDDVLRMDTSHGRVKLQMEQVNWIESLDGSSVRVHFQNGDTLSGSLRTPLPEAQAWYFSVPPPKVEPEEPSAAPVDDSEVVAWVAGEPITLAQWQAYALANMEQDSPKARRAALDALIEEELLYQEGLRQGLDQSPKVKRMVVNSLLRDQVYQQVSADDFDDAELRAYFQANRQDFVVPEKVLVKHILLLVDGTQSEQQALELCKDLRTRAMRGEPFQDLAAEYSQGAYARRGGELGYLSRQGKPGVEPALVDLAFSMQLHTFSACTRTESGVSLITVTAHRDRVEHTFEQNKGAVLRKVKAERIQELRAAYVAELREDVEVETEESLLQQASVELEAP